MDSHGTEEATVAIEYPGLWEDRAFAWTADFSFFFHNPNAWRHPHQIEVCIGGHPSVVPLG